MLINSDVSLILVDHDRVEPQNIGRQQFFPGDVGKFKSQALAERLARQYGRAIGYSVYPYMHDLVYKSMGGGMHTLAAQGIIIGCVDNAAARRSICEQWKSSNWWIDAGNGYSSGQVLIGNAREEMFLQEVFDEENQTVEALPLPTLQLPSLLSPVARIPKFKRDCAEAVIADEQSPVINQAMATLVLEFTHRLLIGNLSWMGAYIDLDAGTLQTVPAEPAVVARMLGVKVDTLMMNKQKKKRRR